jgi:hypothetical protein
MNRKAEFWLVPTNGSINFQGRLLRMCDDGGAVIECFSWVTGWPNGEQKLTAAEVASSLRFRTARQMVQFTNDNPHLNRLMLLATRVFAKTRLSLRSTRSARRRAYDTR